MRLRVQITIIMTLLFVSYSFAAVALEGPLSPMNNHFVPSQDPLEPATVSLEGSIVDNYANFSYHMVFDNSGSADDNEIDWLFELQEGIRLSNISIMCGDDIFWGRAAPEQTAIEIYNESIASNETAVLVLSTSSGYLVSLNLEAGITATISVYAEGLLTRNLGRYRITIPISTQPFVYADFELSIDVISNFNQIAGWTMSGISGFDVTSFSNGISIEYSEASMAIPSQIVLEYILDRQVDGGQILTYNNGSMNFFSYLLAPIVTDEAEQANRQYVFVLDKSGSMSGSKMTQAKNAFSSMIDTLGPSDLLNVISFDTVVNSMWSEPRYASESQKEEAKTWVDSISAGGSTNFHGAVMTGLGMFSTGEYVKAMLVLSDGLPTAGEITSTQGILDDVSVENGHNVSISAVAFGDYADEELMANMAAQNYGFYTKILDDENAVSKMMDFYMKFSTPVAGNYEILVEGATQMCSMQPLGNTPFFNGTEVVISGCYEGLMTVTTTIDYSTGLETYTATAKVADPDNLHVEFIWAQHRISFLLYQVECEGETQAIRDEIVSLGLQYGIIVKGYTALILTLYDVDDTPDEEEPYDPAVTATYTTSPTYSQTTDGTYTTGTYVDENGDGDYETADGAAIDPTMSLLGGALGALVVIIGFAFWMFRKKS